MQEQINDQSMLRVGTILRGIYRIDSYLSSGGFGNTYVATNIEFDEKYAIKEFFMRGITQRDNNQTTVSVSNTENRNAFAEQKEKFKKEARRLRQLKNPHIVSVYDLFEENGTAYYVMDFIDGENLSERLKRTGQPMTEAEVSQILPQILDALQTIHDAGMWHLDLKPANIMMDKAGNIKLIDFGASKQLNAQKGGATTSTAISYTNGYAPREQMEQNYDKFGPWTDLYALGATLYNLLTNKRPPLPTDIDDDMSEDKHLALPMPNVSDKMKQLILCLMKTNRMQRPKDINAINELKDEADSKTTPPPIHTVPKEANEEVTIIASKKGELKKTNIQTPTPPPYKDNVATQNSNDGNSKNHSWLWVLFVGFFIVGLLWLLGTCNSNYSSEPIIEENTDSIVLDTVNLTQIEKNLEGDNYNEPQMSKKESDYVSEILGNMIHLDGGEYRDGNNKLCHVKPFSISSTPINQKLWESIMGNNPSMVKREDLPVDNISWYDCQRFIQSLNKMYKSSFRLPTDDEWEYAAINGMKGSKSESEWTTSQHCYSDNGGYGKFSITRSFFNIYDTNVTRVLNYKETGLVFRLAID